MRINVKGIDSIVLGEKTLLSLEVETYKDIQSVRKFISENKKGKVYTVDIKPFRKSRSLDANALCWKMCSQIASKTGINKEDVYRNAIVDGNEYTPLPIKEEAVEEFQRIWSSNGIGWFAVDVDASKLEGYRLMFAYAGSSTYSTKAMSALIDRLIQDAKAVGADVISEREKTLLLDDWEDKR